VEVDQDELTMEVGAAVEKGEEKRGKSEVGRAQGPRDNGT